MTTDRPAGPPEGPPHPRVVFLVDELEGRGGTELHLLALLRGLRAAGWPASLLVLGRAGLAPLFAEAGIPLRRWPLARAVTPTLPLAAARLAWRLRRDGCGLLVTVHTAADLLGPLAATLARVPCVSSRRDLGGFRAARHRLLGRALNPLVDRFVAPSGAVRDAACRGEGLEPGRFTVIPNGVDTRRFAPGAGRTLRTALGLDEATPLLGCVASLTPVKRPLMLLEAFVRLVRGPRPDAHLLLCGDGPLRARLELQAQAEGVAGQVHLLGVRPDPERVYAALDLHLLASAAEGLSNSLLEAMASGVPVIATAVGGNRELVRDEVDGLLVPPDSGHLLAAAAARLLADPARAAALAAAARQRVLADYSVEAMVEGHAALFTRLLAAPPRPISAGSP